VPLLAIDPGTTQSAYILYDGRPDPMGGGRSAAVLWIADGGSL